jgi:hypothetical protein
VTRNRIAVNTGSAVTGVDFGVSSIAFTTRRRTRLKHAGQHEEE